MAEKVYIYIYIYYPNNWLEENKTLLNLTRLDEQSINPMPKSLTKNTKLKKKKTMLGTSSVKKPIVQSKNATPPLQHTLSMYKPLRYYSRKGGPAIFELL